MIIITCSASPKTSPTVSPNIFFEKKKRMCVKIVSNLRPGIYMLFVSGRRFHCPRDRCFRCRKSGHWAAECKQFDSRRFDSKGYLPTRPAFPGEFPSHGRVSQRPTAVLPNDLEDEIVADGYDDVSQVRDFDTQFLTDHGEVGAPNSPVEVKGRLKPHIQFWQK